MTHFFHLTHGSMAEERFTNLDRAKIHRSFDDFMVIMKTKEIRVNGVVEWPRVTLEREKRTAIDTLTDLIPRAVVPKTVNRRCVEQILTECFLENSSFRISLHILNPAVSFPRGRPPNCRTRNG